MPASRTFRLDSDEDTLLFQSVDGAMPALVYWGPRLGADEDAGAWVERGVPNGGLDSGEALSILPEAGRGFFGHPGLSVHRGGRDFVTQFMLLRTEEAPQRLVFELRDTMAALDVLLELTIDAPTGMITSQTKLTNVGDAGLELQWLAACALPVPHSEILLFDGRWGFEFQPVRQTLKTGAFVKENRTGRTSHSSWPFLVSGEPGFSETSGEVFAFHLGWSGDHKLVADKLRDGRIQVQAGALFAPGEIVLGANESYATPTAYATRSVHGLNGVSDRFHPFVREHVLGGRLKGKTRPVHFNSWEAVYFDHDSEKLKQLVDLAADAGVERFVLDDGWFKGRPNDKSGLGDWQVDPAKYPNGLKPLIDQVHARGMRFGLWVEPEMANADSDLLRAHPDWTLHVEGRSQPLGRGQYVLDLTREEVWDNIFGQIDMLLRENAIAYLKWDMNRDLTHAASLGRPAGDAQTRSVYRLIDALRAAHPHVEIESCSSGGGRADFGILARTDRIWTSDCNDPIDRQHIQRAFSYFLPPEIMGSHVGARRSHTTGRVTGIAMRAFTAFFGHMGIEADLSQMDDGERQRLADIIALHKQCRGIIHAGRVTRLVHDDPACCAFMVSDSGKALVSVAQLDTPRLMPHLPLRLAGLDAAARYKVQLLNPLPHVRMKSEPATLRGEAFVTSGAVLMHAGLTLPQLMAGEIAVFAVEETA
ncbi:MAG TPA: alpha-galactosidase [Rhizomicrobium sp.]|jgi:alpha-galactosidase